MHILDVPEISGPIADDGGGQKWESDCAMKYNITQEGNLLLHGRKKIQYYIRLKPQILRPVLLCEFQPLPAPSLFRRLGATCQSVHHPAHLPASPATCSWFRDTT